MYEPCRPLAAGPGVPGQSRRQALDEVLPLLGLHGGGYDPPHVGVQQHAVCRGPPPRVPRPPA
eukprot:2246658-Prorocentrum_lima.AAC.1